jgi:ribosomal protein L11 methyltransferase
VINPGIAFGTGADTTTQLALEVLERTVRPGDRVFDFGTGSGILALAALRLGAAQVHGCDIDHDAVVAAREDMPAEIGLFTGTLRSIQPQWADVIFANINAETVAHNAEEMKRVLKPGGRLIVGGIPPRHADRVIKALGAQEWTLRERVDRDIWVCMAWEDK